MLVHPQFDPIAFSLGPLAVRWYGLMYLVGFVAALWLGRRRALRDAWRGWGIRDVDDALFYVVLGVILGGRLGYVLFYKLDYYAANPLEIFYIWQGGMSFHGGFLGVLVAMILLARKKRTRWLAIMDFIAPLVPPGIAAGRLGNFINGELWGRPAEVPWAMIFPHVDNVPRHPSQLYECALEGVALFILLWWFSKRPRPLGAVSAMFLIGYGCARFAVEFTREPDSFLGFLAFGWTMGQWLSLPMILAGFALLWWSYRQPQRQTAAAGKG
ncbi:MAG: prolipoprotein diacylglyceryl transferase [Burkholderiales bacterium]|nr:prolipoprotein diacylglyceryl transferase [Burkholderiales bacterium]